MKPPAKQKPWTVRRLIRELQMQPARATVLIADRPFFAAPGHPVECFATAPLEDVVHSVAIEAGRKARGLRRKRIVTVELHPSAPL